LNPCKVLPKILDIAKRFEKPKHSPNVAEVFCGKLFQGHLASQVGAKQVYTAKVPRGLLPGPLTTQHIG